MKHLKKFNELNDFNWDDILKTDKTDNKWSELEKDMMDLVEKYKKDFGVDSYGVIDAMYQIMDGMFQKK